MRCFKMLACASALWMMLGLMACAGDGTLDEVDPEAAPANPTYEEHVALIMEDRCVPCHGESSQTGKQGGYGFETCAEVKRGWRGIASTAINGSSMPPGAAQRLTSTERLTLQRWYDQGAACP